MRSAALVWGVAAALGLAGPAVARPASPEVPKLEWVTCGEGVQCAAAKVPRDYAKPRGGTLEVAVARARATDPARRIGSLFLNFGGPGASAVDVLQRYGGDLLPSLSDRFDLVGFDPRGTGATSGAIDCAVDQEAEGPYAQPFTTPATVREEALVARARRYIRRCRDLNPGILPYVSSADTARDMDLLRAAVGDDRLSYLGFSYGTFLGATYESLFPRRVRAMVLDGALDADQYINRPLESLREQTAGFERALARFLEACTATQDVCRFGGDDPGAAFDALAARLDAAPLRGTAEDPRPVDGDDLRAAAALGMYAKQLWPFLADALARAQTGDGRGVRELADLFYGRLPDGTYDPLLDRYFALGAVEQRYPDDVHTYLAAGRHSWGLFDHFWWNSGYAELVWGLYPVEARSPFYGPFRAPPSGLPTLVVGTTYDPATPYRGSVRLVEQLGNARLLTMRGDGHTAYGYSACVDATVDAYLEEAVVPPEGTACEQEVPFVAPAAAKRQAVIPRTVRPHVRPLPR